MLSEKWNKLITSYKIVVYISEKDFEQYLVQILEQEVNQIGNYKNCLSWIHCDFSWTPTQNASPYIGTINQIAREKEVRLEFKCDSKDVQKNVEFLKKIHPYEEPEIDIIPLLSATRLGELENFE